MHPIAQPPIGQLLYAQAPLPPLPGLLLIVVGAWVAITSMGDLVRELRACPVLLSIPLPSLGLSLVWTAGCHHWLLVREVPGRHGRGRNLKVVSGQLDAPLCSLRYASPALRLLAGPARPAPGSPRAAVARAATPEPAPRRTHPRREPPPQ